MSEVLPIGGPGADRLRDRLDFLVEPWLEVENAKRRVLILRFGDDIAAVGRGRERVTVFDTPYAGERDEKLGLFEIGNVIDVSSRPCRRRRNDPRRNPDDKPA